MLVRGHFHNHNPFLSLPIADDDFAAYVLARALQKPLNSTEFLYERAMRTPFTLFNDLTGFMEARNKDGSWAGETRGWTEGGLRFSLSPKYQLTG